MSFAEKIMGLFQSEQEAPAPDQAEQTEESVLEKEAQTPVFEGHEVEAPESPEEKASYTPEEVQTLIKQRQAEWEQMHQQPATDDINAAVTPEAQRIAELERELRQRDIKEYVVGELEASGIPLAMAAYLDYTDKDTAAKSLGKLKTVFTDSVNEAVKNRLRGKTPEGLGMRSVPSTDLFAQALKKPSIK